MRDTGLPEEACVCLLATLGGQRGRTCPGDTASPWQSELGSEPLSLLPSLA